MQKDNIVMKKLKVSKNLYRGRRILTFCGVLWQAVSGASIAYDMGDGRWMVRPAEFFLMWGEDGVRARIGRFYTVKCK